VTYVILLRGSGGFFLDIEGLPRHPQRPGDKHITLALLGKIKGESQDRDHLIPCSPVTLSGIEASLLLTVWFKPKKGLVALTGPPSQDRTEEPFWRSASTER
jgi:hypothetical protein